MKDYNKLIELSNIEGTEIFFDTRWLFNKTLGKNLNSADLLIRLLAIDNYIGKNNYGFDLYNIMKKKRIEVNKNIPYRRENYELEFRELIKSINLNGFDNSKKLILNKDYQVFDGAHRISCALAFNIKKIPVEFNYKYIDKTYDYSLNWFTENGLGYFEPFILKKYNELIENNIIMGVEDV